MCVRVCVCVRTLHGNGPVLVARAPACTNVPAPAVAIIVSYQSTK